MIIAGRIEVAPKLQKSKLLSRSFFDSLSLSLSASLHSYTCTVHRPFSLPRVCPVDRSRFFLGYSFRLGVAEAEVVSFGATSCDTRHARRPCRVVALARCGGMAEERKECRTDDTKEQVERVVSVNGSGQIEIRRCGAARPANWNAESYRKCRVMHQSESGNS